MKTGAVVSFLGTLVAVIALTVGAVNYFAHLKYDNQIQNLESENRRLEAENQRLRSAVPLLDPPPPQAPSSNAGCGVHGGALHLCPSRTETLAGVDMTLTRVDVSSGAPRATINVGVSGEPAKNIDVFAG